MVHRAAGGCGGAERVPDPRGRAASALAEPHPGERRLPRGVVGRRARARDAVLARGSPHSSIDDRTDAVLGARGRDRYRRASRSGGDLAHGGRSPAPGTCQRAIVDEGARQGRAAPGLRVRTCDEREAQEPCDRVGGGTGDRFGLPQHRRQQPHGADLHGGRGLDGRGPGLGVCHVRHPARAQMAIY